MEPRQLFDLVIALEKDLADFYQELGQIESLKPFADIFSFMTDHSQNHARQIEKAAASIYMPELDTDPIETLHLRVKQSLREEIVREENSDVVMAKLARAEEVIGTLYSAIAGHYHKRAATYSQVADRFDRLSEEEMAHRDYINDRGQG